MTQNINTYLNEIHTEDFSVWTRKLEKHPLGKRVVDDLKDLPQVLDYHAEFCTLKHTFLVVCALHREENSHMLDVGLLHDWGKPETLLIQRETISSMMHAHVGASKVEEIRNEGWIDEVDKKKWLIKRHMGIPLDHKKIKNPPNNKGEHWGDLAHIISADKGLGRDLYWELFDDADYQRNRVLYQRELNEYRYFSNEIFLPIGIPGSGKTTFYKNNNLWNLVASKDEARREVNRDISSQNNSGLVNKVYQKNATDIVMKHGRVFLDETGIFKNARHKILSALPQFKRTALVFPADPEASISRIKNDLENNVDRSNVPEKVVHKFHRGFNKVIRGEFGEFHRVLLVKDPLTERLEDLTVLFDHDRGINQLSSLDKYLKK